MNYNKPKIVALGPALSAVQKGGKEIGAPSDVAPPDGLKSNGAYEADE
jgi:hypothetical protein